MMVMRFENNSASLTDYSKQDFSLYPNPVEDYFIIRFDGPEASAFEVEIRDVLGRKVFGETVQQSDKIYTSEFKPGTYFVEIIVGGGRERSEERRVGKECRSRWWQ